MKLKAAAFVFCVSFFSVFSLAAADIVRLKNGLIYRGKVLLDDDEKVLLAENEDFIRYIAKENVVSVIYEKPLDKSKNVFAGEKSSGANAKSEPAHPYSGIATPIEREPPHSSSQGNDTTIDVTHEIVSDFIWRGLSFSGEMANRRRNDSYPSTTFVPSYQPTININTPLKGFMVQFWGNFQLTERNDRDNDGRFQLYPGGSGPAYPGQGSPYTPADPDLQNNNCVFQTQDNVLNGTPGPGPTCGGLMPKPYKEQNGMKRADGLFYAFYYTFEKTSWGKFTVGTWFYNTFNKNPAYASAPLGGYNSLAAQGVGSSNNYSNQVIRLAWQEYYFFWQLPFLSYLTPTISFYTQISAENASLAAGKNYLSLYISHEYFSDKFFRITPAVNVGYAMSNNIVDNRNGIQDITSSLTFYFGKFFIKGNHVYRPNLYMYDTDNYYGATGGYVNRNTKDGLIVDPSKVNGPVNQYILDQIANSPLIPDAGDGSLRQAIRESYLLQKIPAHLFWFSVGFSHSF
ncbi:hypothetical protein CH379_017690 [Leptospira ellisii]|uniref:Porin n=1 Tax=Leptospira ellisii TaxID=2023197 RepID=A0A2N0BD25_9LEPT|nr:hypothetical protein [Leptospira ellisii]MDV6237470.1 hypothetical protein [Leptospira ellisii]PJZ94460.1 hypothetical protein CH379_02505 [Leptospira ellisii]PKA04811.1 hypothetical protein CH375_08795 [Leptospira ellisii]